MSYQPQHLTTDEEGRIESVQQDRIDWWRRRDQASISWRLALDQRQGDESWRRALARVHREQEIRLQASYIETVRAA